MPIRRLRRPCHDGPGHGYARTITDGIIRVSVSEVLEGIPGAGSVSASCLDARLASADATYGAKFPKTAVKVTGDLDRLAFYDYPAEHWVPLRTINLTIARLLKALGQSTPRPAA